MNLELLLLGDFPVARLIERARLAEANGYSLVWLADERFYREVYTCLGQIAAHTSTVLLGPCVTDPCAQHPALTAVAIATVDEISGGRATLGIGAGISGLACAYTLRQAGVDAQVFEASQHPDRANEAADRLRTLQPGLAHNVHMPSHIDIRCGRWQEAVDTNLRAIDADKKYRQRVGPATGMLLVYVAHNEHMLSYAAMMTGQSELSIQHINAA